MAQQVVELFDTFTFTVCWQGLHQNCQSGRGAAAPAPDAGSDDGEEEAAADETRNLDAVLAALSFAGEASSCADLAGKPEALQACIDQCSSIMRTGLAYAGASSKKQDNGDALLMGVPPPTCNGKSVSIKAKES